MGQTAKETRGADSLETALLLRVYLTREQFIRPHHMGFVLLPPADTAADSAGPSLQLPVEVCPAGDTYTRQKRQQQRWWQHRWLMLLLLCRLHHSPRLDLLSAVVLLVFRARAVASAATDV